MKFPSNLSLSSGAPEAPTRPEDDRHGRWKRRWIAASGAAFGVVLALSLGDISWRTAVMVAAAAVMLAMSGDMLDRVED